jgi:dolichol-phosphate mannosyltransferase
VPASPPSPPAAPKPGQTLVIIPTYNEVRNVEAILRLVLSLPGGYHVLVVDDGSPDGTADRVRAVMEEAPDRVHLLERPGKQGLGTAYVTGFGFALERGYTYVCEMDADFSHNPNDLPFLVGAVVDGADLAIGSRYVGGVRVLNWPLTRLVLSYGAGVYARAITRMPIQDVTAGFKCFHRRVLEALDLGRIRSNGYAFQVEMTYRAWARGFRIVEVPITFTERTEGQSKMSKAIVREAAWKVWELRFRHLLGRL